MAAATSETGVGALALGAAAGLTGFEIYKIIHVVILLFKQLEAQIHNFDTLLHGSPVVPDWDLLSPQPATLRANTVAAATTPRIFLRIWTGPFGSSLGKALRPLERL